MIREFTSSLLIFVAPFALLFLAVITGVPAPLAYALGAIGGLCVPLGFRLARPPSKTE